MGSRVTDVLERAEPGRALTVFCEDVSTARPELRAATEEQACVPTLVALEWGRAPALASELDEIRDALARAATSLWPDWYITAEQRFERKRSPAVALSDVVAELAGVDPKPSLTWLKRAWQRCAKGQLPLVSPLTCAEQVRQLSRALDPRRLVFALSVEAAEASEARVRGVARAAEWLAYESQAKVVLLLPLAWQRHPELDHVAYQSVVLPSEVVAPGSSESAEGVHRRVWRPGFKQPAQEAPQVLVGPVVGKPHPGSEVEQLVHAWLAADPELCPLFEFNQRLIVFGEKPFIADIVWRQGGLVIELDGDEHCRPNQYTRDRDRDYRMYMSGYLTLRITNHEIHASSDAVLEKIRNVVNRLKHREARTAHGL
jgi:very-short-patch-repair endonuclease